jgi:hypothetical protein
MLVQYHFQPQMVAHTLLEERPSADVFLAQHILRNLNVHSLQADILSRVVRKRLTRFSVITGRRDVAPEALIGQLSDATPACTCSSRKNFSFASERQEGVSGDWQKTQQGE